MRYFIFPKCFSKMFFQKFFSCLIVARAHNPTDDFTTAVASFLNAECEEEERRRAPSCQSSCEMSTVISSGFASDDFFAPSCFGDVFAAPPISSISI